MARPLLILGLHGSSAQAEMALDTMQVGGQPLCSVLPDGDYELRRPAATQDKVLANQVIICTIRRPACIAEG